MKIDEPRRTRLVSVLSSVLERLCERNDGLDSGIDATRFHALRPPGIDVRAYLERIARYSNCSEECFVMSLIYIDKFIRCSDEAGESFVLCTLNVHRLLITAVMIAAKFFDDHYYNNAYYAKIGGVARKEMNLLEVDFLFMINFNLSIKLSQYKIYNARLMLHHQALTANTGVSPLHEPVDTTKDVAVTTQQQHHPARDVPRPGGGYHRTRAVLEETKSQENDVEQRLSQGYNRSRQNSLSGGEKQHIPPEPKSRTQYTGIKTGSNTPVKTTHPTIDMQTVAGVKMAMPSTRRCSPKLEAEEPRSSMQRSIC